MNDKVFELHTKYSLKAGHQVGLPVAYNVPVLELQSEYIPKIDEAYQFNSEVTNIIINGLVNNRSVLVQGLHGTGKSTHIEQVAARLNWPCLRINLDGNLTRAELVGRDMIIIKDNHQVTEFKLGIIPLLMQEPIILVLDEYDAARPEILFIIQRLLEQEKKLVLYETGQIINAHHDFRIFATCNTLGAGDNLGIYAGTNILNQAQLDRWELCVNLNYLNPDLEKEIIRTKVPGFISKFGEDSLGKLFDLVSLIRKAFIEQEVTTALSPRTLITICQNAVLFDSIENGFIYSFYNKLPQEERHLIRELYQRCFGNELA